MIRVRKVTPRSNSGRRRAAARELRAVLNRLEPRLARAFMRAAAAIRNDPGLLARLTRAVETGDVAEVERVLGPGRLAAAMRGSGLPPDAASFQTEVERALREGAVAGAKQLGPRGATLVGSLDVTNPQALRYLRETLPDLIREVDEHQLVAVREALVRGFTQGRPAAQIARQVRDTVGLTTHQARAVANFREQLETGTLGAGKHPTTRRLSAAERARAGRLFRNAAAGERARQAEIDRLVERYHASLVNRRARNIARTEATRAFGEGQDAIWQQAQDEGLLEPDRTRRIWIVTPDARLRDDHEVVPEMNPDGVPLNQPFQTPIGPVMGPRRSGNPSFDVNCRCTTALVFDD